MLVDDVRGRRGSDRGSRSGHLFGGTRTFPLTVTPVGASPSAIAATMRGDGSPPLDKIVHPEFWLGDSGQRSVTISRIEIVGNWVTPFRRRATGGDQGTRSPLSRMSLRATRLDPPFAAVVLSPRRRQPGRPPLSARSIDCR